MDDLQTTNEIAVKSSNYALRTPISRLKPPADDILASRVCTATMSRRRPLWILGDTNPRVFVCLEDLQLLQIAA
jgi:hypothetical protein